MDEKLFHLYEEIKDAQLDIPGVPNIVGIKILHLGVSLDRICYVLNIPVISSNNYKEDFEKHKVQEKIPALILLPLTYCYENYKKLIIDKDLELYKSIYNNVKVIYNILKKQKQVNSMSKLNVSDGFSE